MGQIKRGPVAKALHSLMFTVLGYWVCSMPAVTHSDTCVWPPLPPPAPPLPQVRYVITKNQSLFVPRPVYAESICNIM